MIRLTDDQKRAAEAEGCAAVTAGAGTGKTRMLAERYRFHVKDQGLSPLSVVAVTFTDKAAAELRSRIRSTLSAAGCPESVTAEVEAAQISTIHSLAARICRDFYDLAGIPADFSVLDEIDSPLWSAEKISDALAKLPLSITDELGFHWLVRVLPVMLGDPQAAEAALRLGAENWHAAIELARREAIDELMSCAAWHEASAILRECSGLSGDTLEEIRLDVIAAMQIAGHDAGIGEISDVLKRFRSNSGSGKKWDAGQLEMVRGCLVALKVRVKATKEIADLTFGPDDEEAARRIPILAEAYRIVRDHIEAEKLREKVLDFNDLERYALKVLSNVAAVEHYRPRWRAFLVDEFQDTNPIQAEILNKLSAEATLTIVGDEKQSIYGFRGADVDVFARFQGHIVDERKGVSIPLDLTFRSHHHLAVSINSVFEPVLGKLHQPLTAFRQESHLGHPHIRAAVVDGDAKYSPREGQVLEARYIAERIRELHNVNGIPYSDIAIIAKRWAPLSVYGDVLSASGIPAVNAGGGSLLDTRESKDMFALLSFLAEPADDIALVAVLRSPFFAHSDIELFRAARERKKDETWWSLIERRPEFGKTASTLHKLLDASKDNSAEMILRLADRYTGYSAVTANMPQGDRRMADLNGLYGVLQKLDSRGRGDVFGTQRYLRELYATETEIPRPQIESGDAVSLMTIHKAKGLEWPVVFVPDLAASGRGDSSPITIDRELGIAFEIEGDEYDKATPAIHKLIKMRKKAREDEEARRLLYVAMTRAKDAVFLTAGKPTGSGLDILRDGLLAAEVTTDVIPYDSANAVEPVPAASPLAAKAERTNIAPLKPVVKELPVTALSVFAKCPKRFEYQYVDGHPGLSDGPGDGMLIGSLTHKALELDIRNVEELQRDSGDANSEQLAAAIALAERFRTEDVYSSIRGAKCDREVRFTMNADGLNLTGIADLVSEDHVVDFKTDAEMHPEEHRFQLWAYAAGLQKKKASIVYLRHGAVFDFTESDLDSIGKEAAALFKELSAGSYSPTPSYSACRDCSYGVVCDSRYPADEALAEGLLTD
ncbi:MAG: UvrD-helicase domain-containing protein [Pyrinomonadaceae bacterium]|nr:UvrD-helicase domain-containing protein [Pyrinomonadaceae bacterium]